MYLFIYVCFVKGSNAALQYVNIHTHKNKSLAPAIDTPC